MKTTEPVTVAPIWGNDGEADGSLVLLANIDPSPHYPEARIIIGPPKDSLIDIPVLCMSPDKAIELAAWLVDLANKSVAACPSATARSHEYPASITRDFGPWQRRAAVIAAAIKWRNTGDADAWGANEDAEDKANAARTRLIEAVDALEVSK